MEVSSKRIFLKHLEPARPLRRCIQVDIEPQKNGAAKAETLMKQESTVCQTSIGIEQFYRIVNLHKQKQVTARISYTRDFLIDLASCPEAKKKPEYLPDHPIVLPVARDPWELELGILRWKGRRGDV